MRKPPRRVLLAIVVLFQWLPGLSSADQVNLGAGDAELPPFHPGTLPNVPSPEGVLESIAWEVAASERETREIRQEATGAARSEWAEAVQPATMSVYPMAKPNVEQSLEAAWGPLRGAYSAASPEGDRRVELVCAVLVPPSSLLERDSRRADAVGIHQPASDCAGLREGGAGTGTREREPFQSVSIPSVLFRAAIESSATSFVGASASQDSERAEGPGGGAASPLPIGLEPSASASFSSPSGNWPFLSTFLAALFVAVVILYRRLDRRHVLDQPLRQGILAYVASEPGSTAGTIARALGIDRHTALHHLRVLHEFGAVEMKRIGARLRYFRAGAAPGVRAKAAAVAAATPKAKAVLEAAALQPESTLAELASRTGLSVSTVHWERRRLRSAGLLP